MSTLSPEFTFDLESRMSRIIENTYALLTQNLWWSRVAKLRQSASKKERVSWLLATAGLEDLGDGGRIAYDDLIVQSTEFENHDVGKALKLRKNQLEDMWSGVAGGEGITLAADWAAQQGAYMAYWPQKAVATLIRAGESATCYDGQYFFDTDHPVNPYNSGVGTYKNILTSTASGIYPGTCPIDDSVSVDVAMNNLAKAFAYIMTLKMPNGVDPRMLRPKFLVVPPTLHPRALQLSNAKQIAQAAGTYGGGGADVDMVVSNWGLEAPVLAPELAYQTGWTHGNTSYLIICEQMAQSQLGAFVYQEREPFKLTTYTGEGGGTGVDAILARARELEWQVHGRAVAGYGHPYLCFLCKGT